MMKKVEASLRATMTGVVPTADLITQLPSAMWGWGTVGGGMMCVVATAEAR